MDFSKPIRVNCQFSKYWVKAQPLYVNVSLTNMYLSLSAYHPPQPQFLKTLCGQTRVYEDIFHSIQC